MKWLDRALSALVVLAAINVAYLSWFASYDFRLGPIHFVSHGFFKPMLILHTAFFLCVLLRRAPEVDDAAAPGWWKWALAAIGVFWLVLTIPVNATFDEWNYRGYSTEIGGLAGAAKLLVTKQWDAWYRPVGFLSLWLDRQIFDASRWGYHLQNVALHLVNAWLAYALARRWRWPEPVAAWAALLYACAACTYEPVMWPSARFDLLAMAFTGAALLRAVDYLEAGALAALAWSLGWYALAVMSKESGYAFPLLLIPIAWDLRKRGNQILAFGTGLMTFALLAVRWIVVGGLGGYRQTPGVGSPHLSFTPTTIESLLTKLFPVSLFVVNQTAPLPVYTMMAVSLMAALLAVAVLTGASTSPRQRWTAVYALLATGPVVTLVSWLDVTAQHVRYIYMPAMFVLMLTAAALWNGKSRAFTLPAFAILSLAGAAHNVGAYRDTYAHADALAARIADESAGAREVRILNMPAEFNGILFSQFELMYRFRARRPDVPLQFNKASCGDAACYEWMPETRDLRRVGR